MHELTHNVVTSAAVGLFAFIATNLDDLFLVIAFMADPRLRTRDVVIGQYLGMAALVGISCIAALIALVVPLHYLGWLGCVPIAFGIKELVAKDDDQLPAAQSVVKSPLHTVAMVTAVTVANGGDNVGVYVPIFAVRALHETFVILFVFALSIAAWCALAQWLVHHRTLGAPIRKYARACTPIVLILIGGWIIYEAGSIAALQ